MGTFDEGLTMANICQLPQSSSNGAGRHPCGLSDNEQGKKPLSSISVTQKSEVEVKGAQTLDHDVEDGLLGRDEILGTRHSATKETT